MPYTPQTWVDGPAGGTPLSAARMTTIETGIETAQATAEAAAGTAVGAAGTVPVSNGTSVTYQTLDSADVPAAVMEDVTGAYTFVLGDAGKMKRSSTATSTAVTWTIPTNATAAFPTGTCIKVLQRGTGQLTIAGAAGVTLQAFGSAYKTAGVNATVLLTKLFTDTWLVEGGVT